MHAIAVGKEDFLIAVTGHPATAAAADTIISGHPDVHRDDLNQEA